MSRLEVKGLHLSLREGNGFSPFVEDVNFTVEKGKTVALVGESGCGKSITCLSILQLLDPESIRIDRGSILFEGKDLLTLSQNELRQIRGNAIGMVFQDPLTSLNPVFSIGSQLVEAVQNHHSVSYAQAKEKAIQMLECVRVSRPDIRFTEYPYQLSGGMRQRVMIAMALVNNPKLIIADEPTTALDVTVQSQIIQLLRDMQKEFNMAILLVTHDLGVVAEVADRVCVMYAGKIVEQAKVDEIYYRPAQPYTIGLLQSIPRVDQHQGKRLNAIQGQPPSLINLPKGCAFLDRCDFSKHVSGNLCAELAPKLEEKADNHYARCHLPAAKIEELAKVAK